MGGLVCRAVYYRICLLLIICICVVQYANRMPPVRRVAGLKVSIDGRCCGCLWRQLWKFGIVRKAKVRSFMRCMCTLVMPPVSSRGKGWWRGGALGRAATSSRRGTSTARNRWWTERQIAHWLNMTARATELQTHQDDLAVVPVEDVLDGEALLVQVRGEALHLFWARSTSALVAHMAVPAAMGLRSTDVSILLR